MIIISRTSGSRRVLVLCPTPGRLQGMCEKNYRRHKPTTIATIHIEATRFYAIDIHY